MTITGTLQAIDHLARWIGQDLVLPWTEIKVY
jgi:hypothetical protein